MIISSRWRSNNKIYLFCLQVVTRKTSSIIKRRTRSIFCPKVKQSTKQVKTKLAMAGLTTSSRQLRKTRDSIKHLPVSSNLVSLRTHSKLGTCSLNRTRSAEAILQTRVSRWCRLSSNSKRLAKEASILLRLSSRPQQRRTGLNPRSYQQALALMWWPEGLNCNKTTLWATTKVVTLSSRRLFQLIVVPTKAMTCSATDRQHQERASQLISLSGLNA